MTDTRATVRPVTLARLVETVHVCSEGACSTDTIETKLEVSHQRARETILEALRLDLLNDKTKQDEQVYETSQSGSQFLSTVQDQQWQAVSDILSLLSPHYKEFLAAVDACDSANLHSILTELQANEDTPHSYNQTSVEVLGDWAERLGVIQRHAFDGKYYHVDTEINLQDFPKDFLSTFDELEETAGVDLRQRYLSIPELREAFCEQYRCSRESFDEALCDLAAQNVGRLELSGAPMDTGAKEARLGIKEIELSTDDGLVSTTHSTERVMAGVEQLGKQYYYVAVHDRDLQYQPSDTTESTI